jgi:very-short-patch-repair endonuclease
MTHRRQRQLQKHQLHAFLIENGVLITSSDKKIEWFWQKRGSAFMTDQKEIIKDYFPDFLIDTPDKPHRVIIVEVDERDHRSQTEKDCMRDFRMHRRSGRDTVKIFPIATCENS